MLGALIRRSGVCLLAGRAMVPIRGSAAPIRASAAPISQALVSRRWQCSKPEAEKTKSEDQGFKIPGHKPTNFERKILLWSGRFKTESDIPEFVTLQTMDAARNRMRIMIAMMMIVTTIIACIIMVISGKRAAKRQESLTKINLEKKARHKAEEEN